MAQPAPRLSDNCMHPNVIVSGSPDTIVGSMLVRDFREHPSRLEDLLNKTIPYARRVGEGAVIVMSLAGAPDVAWAQVGFHPSPQAAVLLFSVLPALLLLGLLICGVGYFFYRKLWVFILGGVLMAPAIAFAVFIVIPKTIQETIQELVPQKKFWDFSADRSVSRLREESVVGNYYEYQGHIQSTVKLPGNRHWSGTARFVDFTISGNEISSISCEGEPDGLEGVYLEAKRILGELGFSVHALDGWYERVRGGKEDRPFSIRDKAGNPKIHVAVRSYQKKEWIKTFWAVRVEVSWKEAGR